MLRPDETAGPHVERRLEAKTYDCVVIGAGSPAAPQPVDV